MNNFELHELATTLSDTHTPYQLAKALIKSVQGEISLLDNGCGNDLDFNRNLDKHIKVKGLKQAEKAMKKLKGV